MTAMQSNKLKEILKAEHNKLLAFIRSRIDSIEESEDIMQDVYLHVLGNINVLDSIDNLTGWLFTVVKNKIIDTYRRRRHKTVSIDEPDANGLRLEDVMAGELPGTASDPEWNDALEWMMRGIELLPDNQRFVIIEQAINGRTFRELSRETGEPQNTLIARKRYAVQNLRKFMQERKIH